MTSDAAPSHEEAGSHDLRSHDEQRQCGCDQDKTDQQQDAVKQHHHDIARDSYAAVSEVYHFIKFGDRG